jgi:hypothetical protein
MRTPSSQGGVSAEACIAQRDTQWTSLAANPLSRVLHFRRPLLRRREAPPGVLRADLLKDLATMDTTKDATARRWLPIFPPDLPAALAVTMKPYRIRNTELVATHGSPPDYDTHVPVAFDGPWVTPGRHDGPARVVDVAPTPAVVGARPLECLDGHVPRQAIR